MKIETYQLPCQKEDIIIKSLGYGLTLKRIGLQRVPEFISVVFEKYKANCKQKERRKFTEALYREVLGAEISLASQGLFFAIENKNSHMVATLRTIKYDSGAYFPSESTFNLSVLKIAQEYDSPATSIWHCDDFTLDLSLLRRLGIGAARLCADEIFQIFLEAVVSGHGGRYCLAETNQRVENLYKNAGFECQPLSEFKDYWGENRATIIDLVAALHKRANVRASRLYIGS